LNDLKAKKLAQIVSNDSCRKIIDLLAEKDYSETEIAEKLDIPISTVHYNLTHLIKAGLVVVDEFHYSKKGKEINHYKLANKYIIIAPKETLGFKEALKKILPVGIILLVIGAFIQFFSFFTRSGLKMTAMDASPRVMMETADISMHVAEDAVITATQTSVLSSFALWFLIGGLSFMILFLILEIIRNRRK
jgi:DNA-binding transcriptional ArsR family regulator